MALDDISFQDRNLHPIAKATDWLEVRNAGAMGNGAVFKKTGLGVILPVTGERREVSYEMAKAWQNAKRNRYKTANFIDDESEVGDLFGIVSNGDGTGRYCCVKQIWDKCDKDQCKKEAYVYATTDDCSATMINDCSWDAARPNCTREEYEAKGQELCNTQICHMFEKNAQGKLEICGAAFFVTGRRNQEQSNDQAEDAYLPVNMGETAWTRYGHEYWLRDGGSDDRGDDRGDDPADDPGAGGGAGGGAVGGADGHGGPASPSTEQVRASAGSDCDGGADNAGDAARPGDSTPSETASSSEDEDMDQEGGGSLHEGIRTNPMDAEDPGAGGGADGGADGHGGSASPPAEQVPDGSSASVVSASAVCNDGARGRHRDERIERERSRSQRPDSRSGEQDEMSSDGSNCSRSSSELAMLPGACALPGGDEPEPDAALLRTGARALATRSEDPDTCNQMVSCGALPSGDMFRDEIAREDALVVMLNALSVAEVRTAVRQQLHSERQEADETTDLDGDARYSSARMRAHAMLIKCTAEGIHLEDFATEKDAPALINMLFADARSTVCCAAQAIASKVDCPAMCDAILPAVPRLVALLGHDEAEVWEVVTHTLYQLAHSSQLVKEVARQLVAALSVHENVQQQRRALLLIDHLTDDHQSTGDDNSDESEDPLELDRQGEQLAEDAMSMCKTFVDAGVIQPIVAMLSSDFKEAAVSLLANLTASVDDSCAQVVETRAVPPLVNLLESSDTATQYNAMQILAYLTASDEDSCALVVKAGAVSRLVLLLESEDADLQGSAAAVLANLTASDEDSCALVVDVVPLLVHLFESSDAVIQYNAVTVLGNLAVGNPLIADADVVSRLEDLIRSSDADLVEAARRAISNAGTGAGSGSGGAGAGEKGVDKECAGQQDTHHGNSQANIAPMDIDPSQASRTTSPMFGPLRDFNLAALGFKHKLDLLAVWRTGRHGRGDPAVCVAEPARRQALEFFSLFTGRGTGYTRQDLERLCPADTAFIGVTCEGSTGPKLVALVAHRTQDVDRRLVSYVPLLGVSDCIATKTACGTIADEQRWERRGLGRFLLHCVQTVTRERAGGREWMVELQSTSDAERRLWYRNSGFYRIERLSLNIDPEGKPGDYCVPLRWMESPLHSKPWSPMDRYLNFLDGVDLKECLGKTLAWWEQIKGRQLEAPFIDKDLGYSLHTCASIESNGYAAVYGGEFHRSSEGVPQSHLLSLPDECRSAYIDGMAAKRTAEARSDGKRGLLPSTHWGALANADKDGPTARFEFVRPFGELVPPVALVRVGAKGITVQPGEVRLITINYPVIFEDDGAEGSDAIIEEYTHSKTGEFIRYTKEEMRDSQPTPEMVAFNGRIATTHARRPLNELVHVVSPTPERTKAAEVVARLLESREFDTTDSVRWEGAGSNRLTVSGVSSNAFVDYDLVMGDDQASTEEQRRQQRENTLRVRRPCYDAMVKKRNTLAKKGLGLAQLDQLVADDRLGAAFVVAYVYLVEQMKEETRKLHGSCGVEVDSHNVNSASPYAAFGWHPDNHTEMDAKPGPYIEHSAVCQCSPGATSMTVAGLSESVYPGVGGFVLFPAWALHRTQRVEAKPMWKIAAFFEPMRTVEM